MAVVQRHQQEYRKMALILSASALFLPIFFTSHQSDSAMTASSVSEKPALTQDLFSKGEALYQKQCSACHGIEGLGDGKAAYLLYPRPRNFTSGEFRLVSTLDYGPTEEDLFKVITRGMPGSAMPSWEHLDQESRWGLVYYVCYLTEYGKKAKNKKFRDKVAAESLTWDEKKALVEFEIPPDALIQAPDEPAVTSEALERGRGLYVQSCAGCHGAEGKGDGKQEMFNTDGTPTRPRDLTSGLFKGSPAGKDLYYRFMAGLPGSPMPSYFYSLPPQDVWDIIHYVKTLSDPAKEEKVLARRQTIRVARASEELSLDPDASMWKSLVPVYVSITPLWWRNERSEGLDVRALHNGQEIAVLLSWNDETKDENTLTPQAFSDGAAMQFSAESDPPFFAMGSSQAPVTIWNWKASWQSDQQKWKDVEARYPNAAVDWYPSDQTYNRSGEPFEVGNSVTKNQDPQFMTGWGAGNTLSKPERNSAAEEVKARGFGTLTAHPAFDAVDAQGFWRDGKWQVIIRRSLQPDQEGGLTLKPGAAVNVAFAIWDGAYRDRNGQKSVSIWNELVLAE